MRVLLLGATGNLGSRLVPALIAHKHILTIYVRNVPKLRSLISAELLDRAGAIVVGDATDSAALKKVILDHDIEAIVDVAGNQVLPWKEYVLSKIAKAVSDAALEVENETGRPLRAWVTTGIGIMKYPGTKWLIRDYMPKGGHAQHDATRAVIEAIPTAKLRWSLLAVSWMAPADPKQGAFRLLEAPQQHSLLVGATDPPGWRDTWIGRIPIIGPYINWIYMVLVEYKAEYESVADFLAEDLENRSDEWIGKRVAVKMGKKEV